MNGQVSLILLIASALCVGVALGYYLAQRERITLLRKTIGKSYRAITGTSASITSPSARARQARAINALTR